LTHRASLVAPHACLPQSHAVLQATSRWLLMREEALCSLLGQCTQVKKKLLSNESPAHESHTTVHCASQAPAFDFAITPGNARRQNPAMSPVGWLCQILVQLNWQRQVTKVLAVEQIVGTVGRAFAAHLRRNRPRLCRASILKALPDWSYFRKPNRIPAMYYWPAGGFSEAMCRLRILIMGSWILGIRG